MRTEGGTAASLGTSGSERWSLWKELAGLRVTIVLFAFLAVVIVIWAVVGQGAEADHKLELWMTNVGLEDWVYSARLMGFTDILSSGWFIAPVGLLVINLFGMIIANVLPIIRQYEQRVPPAIALDGVLGTSKASRRKLLNERYLSVEVASMLPREVFREFALRWGAKNVGKPTITKDEGGLSELQVACQHGRGSRLVGLIAHASWFLILGGAVWNAYDGFEGEMILEEGKFSRVLETRGSPRKEWIQVREHGRLLEGFYSPGFSVWSFEIARTAFPRSDAPRNLSTRFAVVPDVAGVTREDRPPVPGEGGGELLSAVGHPADWNGIQFFQGPIDIPGAYSATISTIPVNEPGMRRPKGLKGNEGLDADLDRTTTRRWSNVHAGDIYPVSVYDLDATIRVVDIRPETEKIGASAQLEYAEVGAEPVRFWIFQNYPNYDRANRKRAPVWFALDSVKPLVRSHIHVARQPGVTLLIAGLLLLLGSMSVSLLRANERYWLCWSPGKVTIVGWSNRLSLFEPAFERATEGLIARMSKIGGGAKEKRAAK